MSSKLTDHEVDHLQRELESAIHHGLPVQRGKYATALLHRLFSEAREAREQDSERERIESQEVAW